MTLPPILARDRRRYVARSILTHAAPIVSILMLGAIVLKVLR
jgi:hypothetical protein